MWVIKLGGSLGNSPVLARWLEVLATYGGGRVVIVPGGGRFATQVGEFQESWGFNDRVAHRMALLGMDQYGLMLAGIRNDLWATESEEGLRQALSCAAVPVWLPAQSVSGHPAIPQSWDVSSDSLAAWLARRLSASHLYLVKSWQPVDAEQSVRDLSTDGIVDRAFPAFTGDAPFGVFISGPNDYELMRRALLSDTVAGM